MAGALTDTTEHGSASVVRYELSRQAWLGFADYAREIARQPEVHRICEVGAGANPTLPIEFVREHDLEYTILDVSPTELAKAPAGYHQVCADITADGLELSESFDLIFSKMLVEHVRDPQTLHRNVHRALAENGTAVHFFPTLYSPPFVANFLLPDRLTSAVLSRLQPHRESHGRHGKFPAWYAWCRGPGQRQFRRFEQLGFCVEEYIGFFGHSGSATAGAGYYDKFGALRAFHEWLARALVKHPLPWMTSYAYVRLRKTEIPVVR